MSAERGRGRATLACAAWGLTALAFALGSCEGPAAQPTVRVRVVGIQSSEFARELTGNESVTVWLIFRASGDDLGSYAMARDAGASALEWDQWDPRTEVRRAVYWPHAEPFEFTVQVPPVRYREVRVLVSGALLCSAGGGVVQPRLKRFAYATVAWAFTPSFEREESLRVSVETDVPSCVSP